MSDFVDFLIRLRHLMLELNKNKDKINALTLKEYVLDNAHFFTNTPETIQFIDELFFLCEGFRREDVEFFFYTCYSLYFSILEHTVIDVYFLGEESHFVGCKEKLNKEKVNFIFHDVKKYDFSENIIKKTLQNSRLSIFAYDHSGSDIFLNGGVGKPLAYYQYSDEDKVKELSVWYDFLSYQYEKLIKQKPDTVIFGSSYAFRSLTDITSKNTISFSVPGLDITIAHDLYFKINNINVAGKIILCFGFYDLFKEIYKGNSIVYTYAKESIARFNNQYYKSDISTDELDRNNEFASKFKTSSIDVFIDAVYFRNKDNATLSEHFISEKLAKMQADINTERFLSPETHSFDGRGVVSSHNKYKKHVDSFRLNCEKITQIKIAAEKNKQHIYIIIPPVSNAYATNLDEDIKSNASIFFASLESEYFHLHDFSADKDFCYTDFTDGHHLNINGAIKFRNKLTHTGVLSNSEL